MINKLIDFSLKNRILTIIASIAIFIAGLYCWITIRKEAYSDIADTQVRLIAKFPGRSALEVEERVTLPIERVLNAIPKVIVRRSRTINGLVVFQFVFEEGTDDYFARTRLLEKVREADIPAGVDPQLGPMSSPVGEIFRYVIESTENHTAMELRTLQDWVVYPKLLSIQGIADVVTFGGLMKQYHVITDPEKLIQYKLKLSDVIQSIQDNNLNTGGNILRQGEMGFPIRSLGAIREIKDIENIILKQEKGVPIFVRDIGTVEPYPSLPTGVLGYTFQDYGDGRPDIDVDSSIQGLIAMRRWGDTEEMGQRIRDKVAEINEKYLPPGVFLRTSYDRVDLVNYTLRTIGVTLLEGVGIVILVLIFFMGSVEAALVVAATIPLSLLFAFILMKLTGVTANLLSLGAIDFGIIVDGSVVIVENLMRKYRDSEAKDRVMGIIHFTHESASEVGKEIFFSITIIILAYLPIFTFQRIEGRLFSPMAFTLSYAIGGSMLLALTLVPVLMTYIYKNRFEKGDLKHIEWHNPIVEWITIQYESHILKFIDNSKRTVQIAFGIVIIITVLGAKFIGTEFLPELDEGGFTMRAFWPVGIHLQEVKKYMPKMRELIAKNKQVNVILSQLGRNDDGTDPLGPNRLEVYIGLRDYSKWEEKITKTELLFRLRNDLEANFPGVRFSFSQPIMDNLSEAIMGTIADLAIFVIGDDLQVMRGLSEEILAIVKDIPGASEYGIEQEGEQTQLTITIDREKAARFGINVVDIQQIIEAAVGASRISTLYEGPWRFGIVVRYSADYRASIKAIEDIPVISPQGERIPLAQLAKVELKNGATLIFRQEGKRNITVRTNIRGRDQGGFVAEAQKKVNEKVKFPPGYFIKWGGQFENLSRVSKQLTIVLPLTIAIIFGVLYLLFNNIQQVLVAMSCLPFSLIGGMVALMIRGYYFNVSAGIGFISLFGVATISGVLYVSRVNLILAKDEDITVRDAAHKAACIQLRPLLMTMLLALLGLIPAMFGTGVGSDVQRPLATVIVGGLTSGLILMLHVLPSLYILMVKERKLFEE
ncbi:MAG: CusA/CzcA family heavy metal efflux RND transporter [Leptospiraceae bacterium]|nr:CusA/CzcA family heavy metal efflux RND transporter [Leptospiraceae bacterium]